MDKGVKLILLAVLVAVSAASAYAAPSFEPKAVAVKDDIIVNEPAEFTFEIYNSLDTMQEFRLSTLDYPFWGIRTEPLINPITLTVAPKSNNSIGILVDALHITQIGAYVVTITVESLNTGEKISVPVQVGIKSTDPLIGGYVPTVITSVSVPARMDPREDVPIKVHLSNQNPVDYDDMVVRIESEHFNDVIDYTLGPREEKDISLTKKIDPLSSPQKGRLSVTIYKGDRIVVNTITKPYEIIEYKTFTQKEKSSGFLSSRTMYEFLSNNKYYSGQIKVPTTFMRSLFTTTSPQSEKLAEGGKRYILWDIRLEGANTMAMEKKENFLPLFVIIVLVIALSLFYYFFRSPLLILKEAANVTKEEGGISGMKVVLRLRNRGKFQLKEIRITEQVPYLVQVEKEVSIGTLQPQNLVRQEKRETLVQWLVDSLDPGEERVLTYRVSTKLPILGSFSLAAASAKFTQEGKELASSSNRLAVEI